MQLSDTDLTEAEIAEISDNDLTASLSGGQKFRERLNNLIRTRDEAQLALKQLNLGKAAMSAHEEAERLLSHVKKSHDAVSAKCEAIVSEANGKAAEIIANAEIIAADAKSMAQGELDRAKSHCEQAASDRNQAMIVLKEAQDHRDLARKAVEEAVASKDHHDGIVSKLREIIS